MSHSEIFINTTKATFLYHKEKKENTKDTK